MYYYDDKEHLILDKVGIEETEYLEYVNDNPTQVQKFGGAYRVQKVPRGLKIVQQGKNFSHFEIIPNKALSLSQYQALLNKIVLKGI